MTAKSLRIQLPLWTVAWLLFIAGVVPMLQANIVKDEQTHASTDCFFPLQNQAIIECTQSTTNGKTTADWPKNDEWSKNSVAAISMLATMFNRRLTLVISSQDTPFHMALVSMMSGS